MVTLRDCLEIIKDRHSILNIDDINGKSFVLYSSITSFLLHVKENEMFRPLMDMEVAKLDMYTSHEQGGDSHYIDIKLKCLMKEIQ